MNPRTIKIIAGIFLSNVCSTVAIGLVKFGSARIDGSGTLVFSMFFIIPFLMGMFYGWQWRDMKLGTWAIIGWCTISTITACLMSFVFLQEGYLCLLIVFPVIIAMMVTGALIGRMLYRNKNNTLNSSVVGVAVLIFIADVASQHSSTMVVSDTFVVNAPVEKVWPYVVEYDPITLKENYVLFKIGMPSPVQSTVDGHETGAGRKCIFSNGYVFDEKMIVYKPNEELTFDIIAQPRDPEIMGHIDITRGQFILKDNGDGTTTLTGNSWYTLHVFPSWYFDLWAESVTRNVHLRVMEHIKTLSEHDVQVHR